jgi:aspartate kinase
VNATPVVAIACKRDLTVVTVTSTRMLMAHGFLARIFAIFDRHATPVDLVATSEVSVSLTLDDPRSLRSIVEELAAFSTVRVEDGMAIVCMVGEGLLRRGGVAARAFEALREVNTRMISLGASEINLSLVVDAADADMAVRSLHRAFFES